MSLFGDAPWVAASLVVSVVLVGCRAPTQILVDITASEPCASLRGTSITVGPPEDGASASSVVVTDRCVDMAPAPSDVGSIVLVPSGAKGDPLYVRVVVGVNRAAEECGPDLGYEGCIVARRRLRFVPHEPLRLPIAMRAECISVACDERETCVLGVCRSADIVDSTVCASTSACGEDTLPPANGGGVGSVDAGAPMEWTTLRVVYRAPLSGGMPVGLFVGNTSTAERLAIDDDNVYIAITNPGVASQVMRATKTGASSALVIGSITHAGGRRAAAASDR